MIFRSTPWTTFASRTALIGALLAMLGGCATASKPDAMADQSADAGAASADAGSEMPVAMPVDPDTIPDNAIILRDDHPGRYTVQPGDTLWDISARFLNDPWLWPEVWHVNPEIQNPHLIYPGDSVELTIGADGRPQLKVSRGRQTIKLSPQIRSSSLREAIPPMPLSKISAFLGRSVVLDDAAWEALPYVVAQNEGLMINAGDRFYAKNLEGGYTTYGVFRKDEAYSDPATGEYLGTPGVYLGTAVLDSTGELATLNMVESRREALPGDRLYPIQTDLPENFYPRPAEASGSIIGVLDGVSRIGQYQNVVINRGIDDGVEPGQVMGVMRAGELVADPYDTKKVLALPNETSGYLMVYSVFDRVSYGLIMRASRTMQIGDLVVPPSVARR
jgi:hypothetical protein